MGGEAPARDRAVPGRDRFLGVALPWASARAEYANCRDCGGKAVGLMRGVCALGKFCTLYVAITNPIKNVFALLVGLRGRLTGST